MLDMPAAAGLFFVGGCADAAVETWLEARFGLLDGAAAAIGCT